MFDYIYEYFIAYQIYMYSRNILSNKAKTKVTSLKGFKLITLSFFYSCVMCEYGEADECFNGNQY